jgi:hypothetical protein
LVLVALLSACRSAGPAETKPVASLASSRASQEAFRPIRHAFVTGDPQHRALLESRLEWFIVAFPDDGQVPLAKVYLALIAVGRGKLERAEQLARQVQAGASGTTRDLAELVEGSIWQARNDPAQALEHFLPLVGKLIDPYARILLDQEVVAAALAAGTWYEAIAYMDLWLRDAQEDELVAVRARVIEALAAVPNDVLEQMLQTMKSQREGAGYGAAIKKALVARLAVVALEKQDTSLARRLVESTGAGPALGEGVEGLEELASSGGTPTVDGRTIGLLMSSGAGTTESTIATRVADVLTGAMDELRAERGARSESGEPGPPDGVRLLTRDDRDPSRTELALMALASQGASVIIAGFQPAQAKVAAAFSERTKVPVLLLTPPTPETTLPATAYVLGVALDDVATEIAAALARRGARIIVPVGDEAPRLGEPGPVPRVPCDAPTQRAGEPRFPVDSWRKAKVDALLLMGDALCASDAIDELAGAGLRNVWAGLGLEAGNLADEPSRLPFLVARAGAFPLTRVDAKSPLVAFRRRQGKAPSWFATLGHDAVVIARTALRALPAARTVDAAEVADRHRLLSAALAGAQAGLWSTDAGGFGGKNTLPRDIKTGEVK